jgi:hypothetical protein
MKAAAPAYFSFPLFCYSQFVTDLEPGYNLLTGRYPVHRFFHTFVGATAVAAFCALTGKPLCELFLRIWQSPSFARLNKVFGDDGVTISWPTAFITALLGTYSHVILDGIVHGDARPFGPFSMDNPFYEILSLRSVQILCIELGVIGVLLLLTVRKSAPARETRAP